MSLTALIRKYRIAEIPINWYGRTWGGSNLSIGQMGRRYLSVLLRLFSDKLLIGDDILEERGTARDPSPDGPGASANEVRDAEAAESAGND